ncbi:protein kinase A regulatory subunit [Panus rudis PR-1116 ss-1]|nr:protein kinase A regulatory subunit [Panus rudis PR-1116 ss-1]
MSTFDSLVEDLTRDAYRVQPKDALQFCANWFQSRLEEQRARMRDALSHRPSLTPVRNLPTDHYLDNPLSPTAAPGAGPTSPFSNSFVKQRSSLHNVVSNNSSPFGTLNVPGNALLPEDSRSNHGLATPPTFNPTFKLDGSDLPSSPADPPNPFASFANGGSVSPSPGDYLHPPSSTIFARRTSVSAESIPVDQEMDEPLPVFPKTPDQLRRIKASIAKNFIFRDLDEEQESGVLNAMQELRVGVNEVVIRQGDVGEYFYVVEKGLLHCYIRSDTPPPFGSSPSSSSSPEKFLMPGYHPEFGKKVAECREGNSFGELALMYGHPRAATVMSIEPSTLWSLDRITFRTIILKAAHRRRTMYEHFLSSVSLLNSLGPEDRSKIADALVSRVYEDGEAVVRQGDIGDTFFFVEDGEAVVTKSNDGSEPREVSRLHKGQYFGELALLRLEPRQATVSAVVRSDPSQPKLKVAALDAHAFTRLLGPLREIMERNGQAYEP